MKNNVMWELSKEDASETEIFKFFEHVNNKYSLKLSDYQELYRFSVDEKEKFWSAVVEFCYIKFVTPPTSVLTRRDSGPIYKDRYFIGATLNFCENLLPPQSDKVVVESFYDGLMEPKVTTASELRDQVNQLANYFLKSGFKKGDIVACVICNGVEAIIAMLATSALGGVFTSCSPDFGVSGIVDRFSQVKPKFLIYSNSYQYGEKKFSLSNTIEQVVGSIPSIECILSAAHLGDDIKIGESFWGAISESPKDQVELVACDFFDPLYIMYSSGTTGVPKCIVHSVGGTLIQHKKELMLHSNITSGSKLFYFTTCGWMMWNWMVSALSTGSSLVTFDGSVSYPSMSRLWDIMDQYKVTHFGTSPKFLSACEKQACRPVELGSDLSNLKVMLSTGSPLLPEHYDWVYNNVKSDIHLASICGGTDIISCFILGVPTLPVRRGEIQAIGLGMSVESWDETGMSVKGQKGELVCVDSFPSMPVGFLNDRDYLKYHKAYFSKFENIWHHGDYIEITDEGGVIVYGRSDATLNPGGVRIGTAEIYRQVESLPEVTDSLAVGASVGGDVEIVLFIKTEESKFDDLKSQIIGKIRTNLTPRHVPAKILKVSDIPYTRSGKKVELAIAKIFNGEEVSNETAIANRECLDEYRQLFKTLY